MIVMDFVADNVDFSGPGSLDYGYRIIQKNNVFHLLKDGKIVRAWGSNPNPEEIKLAISQIEVGYHKIAPFYENFR